METETLRWAEFLFEEPAKGRFRLVRRNDHRCLYRVDGTGGEHAVTHPRTSGIRSALPAGAAAVAPLKQKEPLSKQKEEVVSNRGDQRAIVWKGR